MIDPLAVKSLRILAPALAVSLILAALLDVSFFAGMVAGIAVAGFHFFSLRISSRFIDGSSAMISFLAAIGGFISRILFAVLALVVLARVFSVNIFTAAVAFVLIYTMFVFGLLFYLYKTSVRWNYH
jgi:hypothetical protein